MAHGIPPLVNDPVLSTACQLHAHYMFLNGGWDQDDAHGEKPSNPGYTVRGAGAARRSVLAGTGWFAPNPWATAPVHLSQVLNPALRRTGYGQESVFICLDTVAGLTTQAADLLTYPGANATGVPPALTAAEITPEGILTTPGVSVGIRTGTRTGPYLMLFPKAPLVSVDAATLTGPAGPVTVAVTDRFVIPRAPLQPRSTYTASVSITTGVAPALQSIQRQWQFVTGAAVPEYSTPTLPLDVRIAPRVTGTKSTPRLTISTRGAAVGRTATFRARRTRKVCRTKCATRPVGATTITRLRLARRAPDVTAAPARRRHGLVGDAHLARVHRRRGEVPRLQRDAHRPVGPQSLNRFSSDRKMLMIETKIPVASQIASSAVPCLRR